MLQVYPGSGAEKHWEQAVGLDCDQILYHLFHVYLYLVENKPSVILFISEKKIIFTFVLGLKSSQRFEVIF